MVKKIGSSNQRFDQGYFGWFKFELPAKEIESVKKTFEENPHMLRMLLITTIRENTYLGKKSPVPTPEATESTAEVVEPVVAEATEETTVEPEKDSIKEMDKSIDDMVKEA